MDGDNQIITAENMNLNINSFAKNIVRRMCVCVCERIRDSQNDAKN